MIRPIHAVASILTAALLCAAPSAFAFNVYTVGTGEGCQFSNIQAAVDAAAANPGEDYVFIPKNTRYAGEHVVIHDQDVDLVGGFPDCLHLGDPGSEQTVVTGGFSGAGHSVFEIEGSGNVYLRNLDISGGTPAGLGGGVYFGGTGVLTLVGVWLHGNQAGSGGAIGMNPSGTSQLLLQSTTLSLNSAAQEGGGIYLNGPVALFVDDSSYITGNSAGSNGGGIKLAAPANAYVSGNLNNNSAVLGGGIAAYASDQGNTTVALYSTDAASRAALYANKASQAGGGVYIKSSRDNTTAAFCAQNFAIDANVASDGAAIYADVDGPHGALVDLNDVPCAPFGSPASVACATGPFCNEIADNLTQDGNGTATNGAVVTIAKLSQMSAYHFAARRNHAGSLVYFDAFQNTASHPLVTAQMHDCLMVDNVTTQPLITAEGDDDNTRLVVDSCTIANNTVDMNFVPAYTISAGVNYAEVTNSIVYDPGAQVIAFSSDRPAEDLTARYDLVNNASTMGHDALGVLQGAPSFVDPSQQDYHLQRGSLGVDYAPAQSGVDLDGNARTVDLTDVPNVFGPLDLGAYEIQDPSPSNACAATDTIFCNDFEQPAAPQDVP